MARGAHSKWVLLQAEKSKDNNNYVKLRDLQPLKLLSKILYIQYFLQIIDLANMMTFSTMPMFLGSMADIQ